MKFGFVFFGLVFAVSLSVFFFNKKVNKEKDELDQLTQVLNGIKRLLKPNSNISVWVFGAPEEIYLKARFCLAPINADTKNTTRDTVLVICNNNIDLNIIDHLTEKRPPLWQSKDKEYCYFLIVNK